VAERQSTYDLSAVFRALGVRTARAIPSIQDVGLVPVVQVGDFSSTFAAEVVESRGVVKGHSWTSPVGRWSAYYLQSLAPGGLVVERYVSDPGGTGNIPTVFTCSSLPWAAGSFDPILPIGGGSIASRGNYIIDQPLPLPDFTGVLGPGDVWGPGGFHQPLPDILERWFVPPGRFIGQYIVGQVASSPVIVFREIPEAQGPV